ncbi:MAG: carboxypeptidase-like regulatory domain-containing protein [Bacteroidales bacterium]|nr:carboxypeptidase-like regulatory domain-containing protein [Bacteroidales bacterium]MDD3989264.1 carboxypeptidase-like regulatory domain-containing protein [Bacteroidales bacterium]MDD4639091.1 carboxypeptidase-like regulatory domain-containing protein [Bacteroidales bacterium]
MKTILRQITGIMLLAFFISLPEVILAQKEAVDYITVSGVVKDNSTGKVLQYAHVTVRGTNVGTITNVDGEFLLKIKDSLRADKVDVSLMGYYNNNISIGKRDLLNLRILLKPTPNMLEEITIYGFDAKNLVSEAIDRIKDNYSPDHNHLTGFYREIIKKRRTYINVAEAVIEMYKTPYTYSAYKDVVRVHKGRKLISQKPGDTLFVKLLGGPNLSIYLDIVKNPDLFLSKETLDDYKFFMNQSVMIDERPHFVVSFVPQVILPYPLHYGKLYIDQETLTFSRATFSLSMDDKNKATQAILKRKPMGLRFKPEEVSFLVTYRQRGQKSYINYVRSEIQFKCDWKKRLFSTNYAIVSEMVVTAGKGDAIRIPGKMAFSQGESLSDKVMDFYDENFWGDYNIIEPDESLEYGVNRLKKANSK